MKEVVIGLGVLTVVGYLAKKFYFSGGKCKSNKRLDGKVAIITGANTGIGYETALDFAKRGARVILACRDLNRANKAASQIIAETDNKKVEVEHLDLADLESVRKFAALMNQKLTRLDLLINNAGLMDTTGMKTKQGFEIHFGVNHLAHFLLTNLLLDLLKKTASSRVIVVSSAGHFYAKLDWSDLNSPRINSGFTKYCNSKLENVLFTMELADRLKYNDVTAVSLHPGAVHTEIFKGPALLKRMLYLLYPIFAIFIKTPLEGAQTTIHCALNDDVPLYNGCYFSDCKPSKMSREATKENATRLWKLSAQLVNLAE